MTTEPRLLALYQDLRGLRFDLSEKPSRWQNLTDLLEILAVAHGIKPTHLNGQGLRSEQLLAELAAVANQHALLTRRTRPLPPFRHREPDVDREYRDWERDLKRRQ